MPAKLLSNRPLPRVKRVGWFANENPARVCGFQREIARAGSRGPSTGAGIGLRAPLGEHQWPNKYSSRNVRHKRPIVSGARIAPLGPRRFGRRFSSDDVAWVRGWASPVRGSRHRSDCGMHPQWRHLGSRIEYRMVRPRIDSGRGGPGCVVHDGKHQSLGKHCETLPAEVRVRPDTGSPVRSRGRRFRACDESSRPILLGLPCHRGCIRVLHFQPIGGAAGT